MTYRPIVHKNLKVMSLDVVYPTDISEYNVGTISQYYYYTARSFIGNLNDYNLVQHTRSDDTFELPAGRYIVRSVIPVYEPTNNTSFTGYVQWQIFSSSSLTGTYIASGTKGRSQPGYKPNDTGDNPGVHSFATSIIESSNTIYVQTRIIEKTNYLTSLSNASVDQGQIIIWRAD